MRTVPIKITVCGIDGDKIIRPGSWLKSHSNKMSSKPVKDFWFVIHETWREAHKPRHKANLAKEQKKSLSDKKVN